MHSPLPNILTKHSTITNWNHWSCKQRTNLITRPAISQLHEPSPHKPGHTQACICGWNGPESKLVGLPHPHVQSWVSLGLWHCEVWPVDETPVSVECISLQKWRCYVAGFPSHRPDTLPQSHNRLVWTLFFLCNLDMAQRQCVTDGFTGRLGLTLCLDNVVTAYGESFAVLGRSQGEMGIHGIIGFRCCVRWYIHKLTDKQGNGQTDGERPTDRQTAGRQTDRDGYWRIHFSVACRSATHVSSSGSFQDCQSQRTLEKTMQLAFNFISTKKKIVTCYLRVILSDCLGRELCLGLPC